MCIYIIILENAKNPFEYRTYVYPCLIQSLSLSPLICRWAEDGSLVDDSGSYTNWYSGGSNPQPQPDGGENANCMYMSYSYDGTWFDNYCDSLYQSTVCSKPIASAAAAAAHNITRA